MGLTVGEFEAILNDESKLITGNIAWSEDEDHSPSVEFRIDLSSGPGFPLFIRGSCNAEAQTLSFALIHRGAGRIYGLCLGKDHHNPDCEYVGETHKHYWSEVTRDKKAYAPPDITAPPTDPINAWRQFCAEARINHIGELSPVPPAQRRLFP